MSVKGELERIGWQLMSHVKFARPRSAIMGWFSHHNIGDDAAEYCFNHYFDHQLAVLTTQTYRRIPDNLKVLICGGGGWLNRDAPSYFLKYIKRVKDRSFPCLFLSGGINRDYSDHAYEDNFPLFKEFMAHFDYVAARDERSRELLESIGVKDVKVMPDIVLSLADEGDSLQKSERQALKTVGLVLASNNKTFKDNVDKIYPFLLKACEALLERGYKVVCIPFQIDRGSSEQKAVDETVLARKIEGDLKSRENFSVIPKLMTVSETFAYIKEEISLVMSMRLHGNVMAASAGVPFISLSYNDKHLGFLEMMKMPQYDIALKEGCFEMSKVFSLLETIEEDYGQVAGYIRMRTETLKQQILEQIKVVRERYLQ